MTAIPVPEVSYDTSPVLGGNLDANSKTITGVASLTVDTLTLNSNTITDSTGTISFDNENLSTSGYVLIGGVRLSGSGTDNFCVNSADNAIAADLNTCVIAGGGRNNFPNLIGTTSRPQGSDYDAFLTAYVADSGYEAGAADVSTILGGYDHINNQLAGTICGGGHNYLRYNSAGHSTIGGGSYNLVTAARATIAGGTANYIHDGQLSTISGGYKNDVGGDYSAIPGGTECSVDGDYSLAFGRKAEANADGCVVFADSTDAVYASTTANSFNTRYSGGHFLTGGPLDIAPTAAVDQYPLVLRQGYDSRGMVLYGYDDVAGYSGQMYLDNGGYTCVTGSRGLYLLHGATKIAYLASTAGEGLRLYDNITASFGSTAATRWHLDRDSTSGDLVLNYGTDYTTHLDVDASGNFGFQAGNITTTGTIKGGGYQSSDGSPGATGSFTTADGKTVTVKNGLITAIA
jgi:hypothetical protein